MMTKMLTNLCVGVTFGNCVMKQNMRRREDIKVIMYLPTSITVTRSINRTNMFTTAWYFGYLLIVYSTRKCLFDKKNGMLLYKYVKYYILQKHRD